MHKLLSWLALIALTKPTYGRRAQCAEHDYQHGELWCEDQCDDVQIPGRFPDLRDCEFAVKDAYPDAIGISVEDFEDGQPRGYQCWVEYVEVPANSDSDSDGSADGSDSDDSDGYYFYTYDDSDSDTVGTEWQGCLFGESGECSLQDGDLDCEACGDARVPQIFATTTACAEYVWQNKDTLVPAGVSVIGITAEKDPSPGYKCWAELQSVVDSDTPNTPEIYSYDEGVDHRYRSCYFATAVGDPHFISMDGDAFDFKGRDNTIYTLLSDQNFTLNAHFKHADYNDAGPKKRLVHGSFMTAAYATEKIADGQEVHIEYDATRAVFISVGINGEMPTKYREPVSLNFGNVTIALSRRTATVKTLQWNVHLSSKVKNGIHSGSSCATGKCFLEVSVEPQPGFEPALAKVAPHGLIGQTFDGDGFGFVGKRDEYKGDEITTKAMGEGAIEGVAADYEVRSKFATDFKFSRWGKTEAKPRNVTALTGMKITSNAAGKAAQRAGAVEESAL